MEAVSDRMPANVPAELADAAGVDPLQFYYHRLWCAACGHVNHGSAWFYEKGWCPSCDWHGVPVDYRAVRRLEPAAPGRTKRAQYVPVTGWTPLFPSDTPRNA